MVEIEGTHILATAPKEASAPDSITVGGDSTWVEYGNGADSTGKGGSSTVVQYGSFGQIEHSYSIAGSVDGLKYDPVTGNIWALVNQDGNSTLRFIDPHTNQLSAALKYGSGYVYGAQSTRGYDDVAFDGNKTFLSYTNPANPGDAVVQLLMTGTAPTGTLQTVNILSLGDTGTNLATGATNQLLPVTDPDSLKLLPDGSLILSSGGDDALTIISHPGTAQQTASFVQLPAGFSPDDAIVPISASGVFTIGNQGSNDVLQVRVSGLNPNDLYADITAKNELVQIDPKTGKVTPILTGLASPHGLAFTPDAAKPVQAAATLQQFLADVQSDVVRDLAAVLATQAALKVQGTRILATAPAGASAPDSITIGAGSTWVEYGNGADSTGKGGSGTIVRYGPNGQVQHSFTIAGSVDGLKYDPATGNVWALSNQDGNSQLRFIDSRTNQVSAPLSYDTGYVYGAGSARGYDDVVFDGSKTFLSYTNPVNLGDAVIQQLVNGIAPVGTIQTKNILSLGDTGTNLVTGETNQLLPVTDPDSLKLLPDGSLILTGGSDDALTIVSNPGTAQQTASFVQLPAGFSPDDTIVPTSSSGVFTIGNQNANDVVQVRVSGLNTHDLYGDITAKNELVQIDPRTGVITPVLTGLAGSHGLAFTPDPAPTLSAAQQAVIAKDLTGLAPQLKADFTTFVAAHSGSVAPNATADYAGTVAQLLDNGGLQKLFAPALLHHA